MIDRPEITEIPSCMAAVVPLTIPRSEIRTAMGAGYGELMTTIAAQGIAPAGPWFTHHRRMDPELFDFEISVPVTEPVVASGRVELREIPAMRVARTIYHGGYEGLGGAWEALDAWMAANGHTAAGDLRESYLVGPESSADPADWQTELQRPLAGW